jgi:hypothetical protein
VEDGELICRKLCKFRLACRDRNLSTCVVNFFELSDYTKRLTAKLPDEEFINDLNRVTDIYGAALKTPVKFICP